MKLTVIILNYNVHYFLEQCLLSVQRAIGHIEAEIIVVDNDSKDGSCEMVQKRFPKIILLQNKENVGFSRANNQAVKIAKGEFICILNPDTAVTEAIFTTCFKVAETIQKIGILGVAMIDGTGNFLPESKRNIPTPKRSLLKLMGFTSFNNGYYANALKMEESGSVEVLAGAFMFMKRAVFEEIKGFDEAYFMYGEDIDISYKMLKAGYVNYYCGELQILHYKGESTVKDEAYYQRFYGAMQIFYKKHFKTNILLNKLVTIGVSVSKSRKKRITENVSSIEIVYTNALLFTENFDLVKRIKKSIEIPVKPSSKSLFQEDVRDTLLIFDVAYMRYAQIFEIMKKFKNRGNQFKIIPLNCNFMVGSDRSDEKGSVIFF